MLETVAGVTGASINPRTGSLLITWNEAETSAETLLETIEGFAAFFFADHGEEVQAEEHRPADEACPGESALRPGGLRGGVRARQGRVRWAVTTFGAAARVLMPASAKRNPKRAARILQNRTMLGALALSIGALGVKQTGLHLWAGAAFLALLALHLGQHRRVL